MFKARRFTKEQLKKQYGMGWAKLRKKKLIEYNYKCFKCNRSLDRKEPEYRGFDLDHKIPVCVGGDHLTEKNLFPLCNLCHSKKTGLDNFAIKTMKRMLIIKPIMKSEWHINTDKETAIIIFNKIRKTYKILKQVHDDHLPVNEIQNYALNKLWQ